MRAAPSRATKERQQALAEAFRLHASRAVEAHLATLAEGVTNEQMRASYSALLAALALRLDLWLARRT